MKRLVVYIVIVVLSFLVFAPVLGYFWYLGWFGERDKTAEHVRELVDKKLEFGFNNYIWFPRFLNTYLFRNGDKYAWRPPRVLPHFNSEDSSDIAYEVYGMVTFWDPDARLLGINSYIGKSLVIRFEPEQAKPFALVPRMNKWGAVTEMRIVSSVSDPLWQTVFCPSDIVSFVFSDKMQLYNNSQAFPLTPRVIILRQRVCKV